VPEPTERRNRERQIEFPPMQSHDPRVTPFMLGLSIVCVIIVVILVAADIDGPFIGPW
jgi:UDP-N-acetylmuramyl pentapeptide phosphotransferase/UDP-N-acetylglucosamine-1-phosphate transferase